MHARTRVTSLIKVAALGLSMAVLAACGGGDAAGPPEPSLPTKATVNQLTNVSSSDYANNRWGLIEASTLQTFVQNWNLADTTAANLPPNGRPAHLASNARLVVLQLNAANRLAGENFIPSNPANNVYVYELDAFRFNEVRDTGLISNSVRYQASGPTVDAWLARYGIDLGRDLVVLVAGENTAGNGGFFQDLGRATYWLTYWGANVRNVAIVNGTLKQNYNGTLVNTATAHNSVSNGSFSVKSLRTDNTGITVSLEDVLAIVDANRAATGVVQGFNQQLIIDARPTPQFTRTAVGSFNDTHPGQYITTAWNSTGAPSNDATGREKSYVLYEGHIKGAVSFPWANLLQDVGGGNFKYKSKADLQTIFTAAGYAPGDISSKVIVSQCRTNFEVQVNGFAARAILGYPTVFFDGSLVEYTSLVSGHADNALNLQPADPAYKFRTDTAARSQRYAAGAPGAPATTVADDTGTGVVPYNTASGTGAADRKISPAVINRNATTTRKALDQDRDYKLL